MIKISIIYRCCEADLKASYRPKYFSKMNCLVNFLDIFRRGPRLIKRHHTATTDVEINIIPLHDGPCGQLYEYLDYCGLPIEKINVNSNEKSLEASLSLGASLPETDIIYFVEDDYLHTEDALSVLIDGFFVSAFWNHGKNIITCYDHPDRYTREDDVDLGQTRLFLGSTRHWRTAESTTCTWAVTQNSFLNHGVYEAARAFKLNDRELFRKLRKDGVYLLSPIGAASTHCHIPFMSPFVDWADLCM